MDIPVYAHKISKAKGKASQFAGLPGGSMEA